MLRIGIAVSSAALFLAAMPSLVHAASGVQYPTKPVRVVIAQSPGSSIDTMGRIVFSSLLDGTYQLLSDIYGTTPPLMPPCNPFQNFNSVCSMEEMLVSGMEASEGPLRMMSDGS